MKTRHSNLVALTVAQENAVDLLAAGKNDTQTAEALGLNRVSVTRWRNYSPEFRAALAARRAEIWGIAADRLRAMLPMALDTLAAALERGDDKVAVALGILKLAGPLPLVPVGPADAEGVVIQEMEQERKRMRQSRDGRTRDLMDGLPDFEDHQKTIRKRLTRLANVDFPDDGTP